MLANEILKHSKLKIHHNTKILNVKNRDTEY